MKDDGYYTSERVLRRVCYDAIQCFRTYVDADLVDVNNLDSLYDILLICRRNLPEMVNTVCLVCEAFDRAKPHLELGDADVQMAVTKLEAILAQILDQIEDECGNGRLSPLQRRMVGSRIRD